MVIKSSVRRGFSRLLKSRSGAAEIVGSIMFLLILLFFFTNVYLWHDSATRGMNDVLANRMNSPVSIEWSNAAFGAPARVTIVNKGGVDVALSRLWIATDSNHNYANLEKGQGIWLAAGEQINFTILGPTQRDPLDDSLLVSGQTVCYNPIPGTTFKILTTLGNTAACQYPP